VTACPAEGNVRGGSAQTAICFCTAILAGVLSAFVWHEEPYRYGIIIWVKKTLNIDDKLFHEAKLACGAATDTETVRLGLEALVRHAAYERLRALRGAEPQARDVPRRRERPQANRGAR